MIEVNKDVLKDAANRLMFDMDEKEYDVLLKEFDIILDQLRLMEKIDGIDKVTPMTFPFDVSTSTLRDDISLSPLERKEALKNAKNVKDDQIKLPKVVG